MRSILLIIGLIVNLQSYNALCQIDPICDTIMAKFLDVVGGKENIKQIQNTHFEYQSFLKNGDTLIFKGIKIGGKKYRFQMESSKESHVIVFTNGKAKQIKNGIFSNISDSKQLEFLELQSYILPEMAYKDLGYSIKFEGIKERDGKEYYLLIVMSPKGRGSNLWYEKQSGFLAMTTEEDGTKSVYYDYQSHNGLWFPNRILSISSNGSTTELFFKSASIDTDLDLDLFKL